VRSRFEVAVEAIVDGGGRKKMRWRRMVENESDGEGF
jgi:hypothetical protein